MTLQDAFTAWEKYVWEAVSEQGAVKFFVKDNTFCTNFFKVPVDANFVQKTSWKDLAGKESLRSIFINEHYLLLSANLIHAVYQLTVMPESTVLQKAKRAEKAAQVFYFLMHHELDMHTWPLWEKDFAYFASLHAHLQHALRKEASKHYKIPDAQSDMVLFLLHPVSVFDGSGAANQQGFIGAVCAEGRVGGTPDVWLMRLPESVALNVLKAKPSELVSDLPDASSVDWETITAFTEDGISLPDAVETVKAIKS